MLSAHDLLRKLAERKASLIAEVAEGRGVPDWNAYVKKTAQIKELTEVELICADSEKSEEKARNA
jgi:hypothetical protein